jgi:hypothetical protein
MYVYRMLGTCGVIDTANTLQFLNNFDKWKSYENGFAVHKKLKNACCVIKAGHKSANFRALDLAR